MAEEGIPLSQLSQQLPISQPATKSAARDRLKHGLAVLLVVGVVATVAVCGTAAAVLGTSLGNKGEPRHQREVQVKDLEAQHQKMMEHAQRSVRRVGQQQRGGEADCCSEMSNHTIPAAHIDGRSFRWEATTPPRFSSVTPSYTTSWTCSGQNNAYVAGGMVFNQTDKKLYVPMCGYYYISSQINFYFDPGYQPGRKPLDYKALHHLYVDRNCSGQDTRNYKVSAYSPLGDGTFTSEGATYMSDMVKICAGGKIWVSIPDTIPCCPRGTPVGTFLAAYLVHETDCEWPPN